MYFEKIAVWRATTSRSRRQEGGETRSITHHIWTPDENLNEYDIREKTITGHRLLCVLSVCWLFGCSDGWVMRWLADWMVGWFVCDHSCDGRRAPARAKDSWKPGRERSSTRIEVGRSWFFFIEERLEERIAEQIVGVLGPQADQTVDLDMLRFRKEMFEKSSSQQHFVILDVSLLRQRTGRSYPAAKGDKGKGSSNVTHRSGDKGSNGKVYRKKVEGEWRWPVYWCLPLVWTLGSLAISMQMNGRVRGTGPSVSS